MTYQNHYHNPVSVHTQIGAHQRLGDFIRTDVPTLFVSSAGFSRRGVTQAIKSQFSDTLFTVVDDVEPNPQLDYLENKVQALKSTAFKQIIALGGGSVMDSAKALAAILDSNDAQPLAHVFRQGAPANWQHEYEVITLPTSSGTGAEVTPFATIWDAQTQKKFSVAGQAIYPSRAILDASLCLTLPTDETLFGGLDAISHALESLWNVNRSFFSTAFALQALSMANRALPQVLAAPDNLAQRERMQQASLIAGFAICQTRTAIAHSISYPVTTHFGVPHGLACSFTLPALLQHNLEAIAQTPAERMVLEETLALLQSLNLPTVMQRYITSQTQREHLFSLQNQMYTKERSGNFSGEIPHNLSSLLANSLL